MKFSFLVITPSVMMNGAIMPMAENHRPSKTIARMRAIRATSYTFGPSLCFSLLSFLLTRPAWHWRLARTDQSVRNHRLSGLSEHRNGEHSGNCGILGKRGCPAAHLCLFDCDPGMLSDYY